MSTDPIKSELETELTSYLDKINRLPLHPKNKIRLVCNYVHSKFRWRLSIYNLSETWIIQTLDNKINSMTRRWLQIPRSGNITHLRLPSKSLGMNKQSLSDVSKFCRLSVRSILKRSKNNEIFQLYQLTSEKEITINSILNSSENYTAARTKLRNDITNETSSQLSKLTEQNTIMQHIKSVSTKRIIECWNEQIKLLPENIYNFARKALVFSLPNNTNLVRWKKSVLEKCPLCPNRQTQLHVLNNCSKAVEEGRYWRHDSVLTT